MSSEDEPFWNVECAVAKKELFYLIKDPIKMNYFDLLYTMLFQWNVSDFAPAAEDESEDDEDETVSDDDGDSCESDDSDFAPKKKQEKKKLTAKKPVKTSAKPATKGLKSPRTSKTGQLVNITNTEIKPTGIESVSLPPHIVCAHVNKQILNADYETTAISWQTSSYFILPS